MLDQVLDGAAEEGLDTRGPPEQTGSPSLVVSATAIGEAGPGPSESGGSWRLHAKERMTASLGETHLHMHYMPLPVRGLGRHDPSQSPTLGLGRQAWRRDCAASRGGGPSLHWKAKAFRSGCGVPYSCAAPAERMARIALASARRFRSYCAGSQSLM